MPHLISALPIVRRLAALAAIAILVAGCAGAPQRPGPVSASNAAKLASLRADPAAALGILNAYRAGRGLGPVRLDSVLTAMAQRQADAMARANALSHDAGGDFTARVHAAGLDAAKAAENLGAGYYSTQEAFAGWRQSPGHDANLRMPEATRMGIALAKDAGTSYGAWWALVLAGEPEQRITLDAGPLIPVQRR